MAETIYGKVLLSSILPSRFQMRKVFDKAYISKLGVSIKNHGLLVPIMVWRVPVPETLPEGVVPITAPDGTRYCNELIYGECRELGAKEAGLTEVPALTALGITEREVRIFSAIENINRKDLTFVEEARCFKSMLDDGLSQEEIAKEVKYDPSYISYSLKILDLPEALLEKLLCNNFSRNHAIQLTRLPTAELQEKAFDIVISKNLNVAATSKLVDKLVAAPEQAEDIIAGHTAKELKPEADWFKFTVIKPSCDKATEGKPEKPAEVEARQPTDDVKPPATDAEPGQAATFKPCPKTQIQDTWRVLHRYPGSGYV